MYLVCTSVEHACKQARGDFNQQTDLFRWQTNHMDLVLRPQYHCLGCFCARLIWHRTTHVSTDREITDGAQTGSMFEEEEVHTLKEYCRKS